MQYLTFFKELKYPPLHFVTILMLGVGWKIIIHMCIVGTSAHFTKEFLRPLVKYELDLVNEKIIITWKFYVMDTVKIKIMVIWSEVPFSFVNKYQRLRGTYCVFHFEDGDSRFLRNNGFFLPYNASHLKRP
jgi:hypothetical protein